MNTKIQVFKNKQFGQIRTMVMPDGQIGFVGKDVAEVLGYSNARDALRKHVHEDDKVVAFCDSLGGKQQTIFINESGLYALILSSKLPKAREFKHWVTAEVLPQIRKTGGYGRGGGMTDMSAQSMMTMLMKPESIKMLCKTVVELDEKVHELQPKAEYTEQVLLSPTCYTMTQVAKGLSMTVGVLQLKLMQKGIIYRSPSGPFMLYAKYLDRGLEAYRTKTGEDMFGNVEWTNTYLVWTEKGRKFINELLSPPTPKGGVL